MNEKIYIELNNLIAKDKELINVQEHKEIFVMWYIEKINQRVFF